MSVRKYASNKKVIEANQILRSVCEVYHYKYIDLYDLYVGRDGELMKEFTKDGVHLLPEHYDKWAEKIRPLIYE